MTDEQLKAALRIAVDALTRIAERERYHGLGSVTIARRALRELAAFAGPEPPPPPRRS